MKDTFIIETSARHVHLSKEHLEILFGNNYSLTKKKDLSQPGQFLSEEKVEVFGEKGSLKCSILGPVRSRTQVELSLTDARSIGVNAPIRESGDLDNTGTCEIKGPLGKLVVENCVIAAKRHLHATPEDAKNLNIKNGQNIMVATNSNGRRVVFNDVVVRVRDDYALAMHIDTDEANASFGTTEGTIVR